MPNFLPATEELVKVTKKKVEVLNESNGIDLMATKIDDTANGKEYFRLKQKLALAKDEKLVEQELAFEKDVCGGGK